MSSDDQHVAEVYYSAFAEDRRELALDWSEMYECERRDYLEKMILDANMHMFLW